MGWGALIGAGTGLLGQLFGGGAQKKLMASQTAMNDQLTQNAKAGYNYATGYAYPEAQKFGNASWDSLMGPGGINDWLTKMTSGDRGLMGQMLGGQMGAINQQFNSQSKMLQQDMAPGGAAELAQAQLRQSKANQIGSMQRDIPLQAQQLKMQFGQMLGQMGQGWGQGGTQGIMAGTNAAMGAANNMLQQQQLNSQRSWGLGAGIFGLTNALFPNGKFDSGIFGKLLGNGGGIGSVPGIGSLIQPGAESGPYQL